MQDTITTLPNEEAPSLLRQLMYWAEKLPEPQLKALIKFLQKKQLTADMAALSNAYKPGTDFPIPFEELGLLLEAAAKSKPDA